MKCSVNGCESSILCKGACQRHYRRLRLYGDPLGTGRPKRGVCRIDGCDKDREAQGLCGTHYTRLRRTGTTERRPTVLERFDDLVAKSGPDECWPWQGPLNSKGYGRVGLVYAHRVACERAHGAPVEGQVAMHSCDNPPCCNPAHLTWGTQQQNIQDSWARTRRRSG